MHKKINRGGLFDHLEPGFASRRGWMIPLVGAASGLLVGAGFMSSVTWFTHGCKDMVYTFVSRKIERLSSSPEMALNLAMTKLR